jgi:DNA-binding NtrC family response regulator
MKILIAEDDPDLQVTYGRIFGDYDLTIVDNAELAIETLIYCGEYDVVVSDFELAGGSTGAQIYSWAKTHKPALKFIFVTGNPHARRPGVPCFLKPFSINELRKAVES